MSKAEKEIIAKMSLKNEVRSKTISLRVSNTVYEYLKNNAQSSVGDYIVGLIVDDMLQHKPELDVKSEILDCFR